MNTLSIKKEVYQFQVACVLYLKLEQNKALKENIDTCLYNKFDEKTPASMRKTLRYGSNRAISQTMFYEKRKSIILKVLGVVIYCFIDRNVCVDYLCIKRESQLSSSYRGFEDT